MANSLTSGVVFWLSAFIMVPSSLSLQCYNCTSFETIGKFKADFLSNSTSRLIQLPTTICPDILTKAQLVTCQAGETCLTVDQKNEYGTITTSRLCAPPVTNCPSDRPNTGSVCTTCSYDRCNGAARMKCYECQEFPLRSSESPKSLLCLGQLTDYDLTICHTGQVCLQYINIFGVISRTCSDPAYCLINNMDGELCETCSTDRCNDATTTTTAKTTTTTKRHPIECYSCFEGAADFSTNATFNNLTIPKLPTKLCPDDLSDDQAVTCEFGEACITLNFESQGINTTARMCGSQKLCSSLGAEDEECDACVKDLCNGASTIAITTMLIIIPAFTWKYL